MFRLRDWVHTTDRLALQCALDEVFQLIRDGTAVSQVAAVFPQSAIQQALEFEASPGRQGKVLISISNKT